VSWNGQNIDVPGDFEGLTADNAFIIRENTWEFSNYIITAEIPFFARGGDFVSVAKSGDSNAITGSTVLELVD
jgi:hypothetical protein